LQELAFGQIRLAPDDFWGMTPREFWNCLEGWSEHERFLQREQWERTRLSTYWLFIIQLKPEGRPKLKDFMPFKWDKEDKKEVSVITPEELEKLVKFYGNKSGSQNMGR
jgi:hypothetical protein